jgi:hypothetical protein
VAKHRFLDPFGEVVPQMPAISDLDRLGRAAAGAVGVGTGPVAADDLGAGMRLQPGSKRLRLPVLQQVDRPVGGHVHQHGAVDPATPERKIIHTQHGHLVDLGVGQRAQQPQQRVAAGRQPKPTGQPRTGAACQRQADGLQHPLKQRGSPGIPGGQPRDLLGERASLAVGVLTEEAAHAKAEHHPFAGDRRVAQSALVAAVHPGRGVTAVGAGGRAGAGVCPDVYGVFGLLDPLDRNGGQVR